MRVNPEGPRRPFNRPPYPGPPPAARQAGPPRPGHYPPPHSHPAYPYPQSAVPRPAISTRWIVLIVAGTILPVALTVLAVVGIRIMGPSPQPKATVDITDGRVDTTNGQRRPDGSYEGTYWVLSESRQKALR